VAENLTVNLATSTWSPYTLEELPDNGLLGTLIKASFKTQKIETNFIFLPSARAPLEAKKEPYNGYFPSYDCDKNDFQQSSSLGKSSMGFAVLKQKDWDWNKLTDLKGKVIGNVRNRFFTEEFKILSEKNIISIEESNTDLVNLTKLLHGRIDISVIEKNIFEYLISITPEFKDKFNFENKYIKNRDLYICFNKAKKSKNFKNKFNLGISKIDKDNIIFQYIMLNY
jgi:polar amino acid transport system substrate-binding protein